MIDESPIIYEKDNYVVIKCPLCNNFSIMGLLFLSEKNISKYESHILTHLEK